MDLSLGVIVEESEESSSNADSIQVSARVVSGRATTASRSSVGRSSVLNSVQALRKPHVPKYKQQQTGLMFGVEAKKFFNFNDGMKDEAFRQQQRAVDNDRKKEAFKIEIQQQL